MQYTPIRRELGSKGGWFIHNPEGDDPRYLAEMTYRWEDGHMAIVHTGVRDSLSGLGVGKLLVQQAVDAARAEGFLIIPHCSYARMVLRRDKSAADVLVPGILDRYS